MTDKALRGIHTMTPDKPFFLYLSDGATHAPQFKRDADGGITLYIQHETPGADKESDWLPAPAAPFSMAMRIYGPEESVMNNERAPLSVQRVD